MHFKYLTFFLVASALVILLSCVDSNPVTSEEIIYPDTLVVIDTGFTLATPTNILVDSLAILDTSYKYSSYDTNYLYIVDSAITDSSDTIEIVNDTVVFAVDTFAHYDTVITFTKIELDSILASFIARWNPVTGVKNAKRYYIFVHDSTTGDLIRTLKSTDSRVYVGGLRPNATYKFAVAALWDTVYDTTISIKGVASTKKILRAAVSKKSDFRFVRLFLPNSPDNFKVTYAYNTATVSWNPYTNTTVTGYRVFLRDTGGTVIDSTDTLDAKTASASFAVTPNSVYKINIITIDSIGVSVLDSVYPYDISTASQNSLSLPNIYLSTYTKPNTITNTAAGTLIGIKGGIFIMGDTWIDSDDNHPGKPSHEVVLSSFYLGDKEVTIGEYVGFVNQQKQAGLLVDTTDTLIEYITHIVELYDTAFSYDTTYDTLYEITGIDTSYDTLYDTIINPVDTIIDTIVNTIFDTTFDSSSTYINTVKDSTVDSTIYIGADTTVETIYVDTLTIYMSSISDNDTFMINPMYVYVYKDSVTDTVAVDSGRLNYPISGVFWRGAAAYCNWLSGKEGLTPCYNPDWSYNPSANGYRLPTEAEFEYAHSAAFLGTKQRYPWGYKGDTTKYSTGVLNTKIVGAYNSYFGLYDMSGNVMEWCHDWSDMKIGVDSSSYYGESLSLGVVINPLGPAPTEYHVLRGGSHKTNTSGNSSAWRHRYTFESREQNGFRVARSSR